jgi:hypothetical protein
VERGSRDKHDGFARGYMAAAMDNGDCGRAKPAARILSNLDKGGVGQSGVMLEEKSGNCLALYRFRSCDPDERDNSSLVNEA